MDDLTIKEEFHFQWRKMELDDLYSQSSIDRAYELLQCSGELPASSSDEEVDNPLANPGYLEESEDKLREITKNLVRYHQNATQDTTPFTTLQHKQFLTLCRVQLAFMNNESAKRTAAKRRTKDPKVQKKEENTVSPLALIGVRAGLPLLFSLVRRSWRRSDSHLSQEVFTAASEILSGFEPLALYHHEASALGEDSLNRVALFLQNSLGSDCDSTDSDKKQAAALLFQLSAQRGSLRYILRCIEYVLRENVRLEADHEKIGALFQWFCSALAEESPSGVLDSWQYCIDVLKQNELGKDLWILPYLEEKHEKQEAPSLFDVALIVLVLIELCCTSHLPADSVSAKEARQSNEPTSVFMWGSNASGELSDATSSTIVTEPVFCSSLSSRNPVLIELGSHCTTIIADDGQVYACGKGEYGRLGTGNTDDCNIPTLVAAFKDQGITKIATSRSSYGHGLAVDQEGHLWSWGDGDFGKLGHGDVAQCNTPKKVQSLITKQVVSISCGYKHSACATSDGKVYTWGLGDYGRLGHRNSENLRTPKQVNFGSPVVIKMISCGNAHTMALSDSGDQVWSWGDGDNGKLGHGDTSVHRKPERIVALGGQSISLIECGDEVSMALSSDGKLFSWGKKDNNGHESSLGNVLVPKVIESLEPWTIVDVKAVSHCVALASTGEVFTWGRGEGGALGSGASGSVEKPTLVATLQNRGIRQIAAGSQHSAAWTVPPTEREAQSKVRGLERAPYCIDLNVETFRLLRDILARYTAKDEEVDAKGISLDASQQKSLLLSCLNILRTNLFHVTATLMNPKEYGLSASSELLIFFRDRLLHLLTHSEDPAIQKVVQQTFEVGWGVLLPTPQERRIMLSSLLQNENDGFSSSQQFLAELLVNSLVGDYNMVGLPFKLSPTASLEIPLSITPGDLVTLEFEAELKSDTDETHEAVFKLVDANDDACLSLSLSSTGVLSVLENEAVVTTLQADGVTLRLRISFEQRELHLSICDATEDEVQKSVRVPGTFTEVDRICCTGMGSITDISQVNDNTTAIEHASLFNTLLQRIESQCTSAVNSSLSEEPCTELALKNDSLIRFLDYLQRKLMQYFNNHAQYAKLLIFQHSTRELGRTEEVVPLGLNYGSALIAHCSRVIDLAQEIAGQCKNDAQKTALVETLKQSSVLYSIFPKFLLTLRIAHEIRRLEAGSNGRLQVAEFYLTTFDTLIMPMFALLDKLDQLNRLFPVDKAESREFRWGDEKEIPKPAEQAPDPFQWLVDVERTVGSLLGMYLAYRPSSSIGSAGLRVSQNFSFSATEESDQKLVEGEPEAFFARLQEKRSVEPVMAPFTFSTFACLAKFSGHLPLLRSLLGENDLGKVEIPESIAKIWDAACDLANDTKTVWTESPSKVVPYLTSSRMMFRCLDWTAPRSVSADEQPKSSTSPAEALASLLPYFRERLRSTKEQKSDEQSTNSSTSQPSLDNLNLIKRDYWNSFQSRPHGMRVLSHLRCVTQTESKCLLVVSQLMRNEAYLRSVQFQILRSCFLPSTRYWKESSHFVDDAPSGFAAHLRERIEETFQALVELMKNALDAIEQNPEEHVESHLWMLSCAMKILGTQYFSTMAVRADVLNVIWRLITGTNSQLQHLHQVCANYLCILLATLCSKEPESSEISSQVFDLLRRLIVYSMENGKAVLLSRFLNFVVTFASSSLVRDYVSSNQWFELFLSLARTATLENRLMVVKILERTLAHKDSTMALQQSMMEQLFTTLSSAVQEPHLIVDYHETPSIQTDGCSFHHKRIQKATVEGSETTFRQTRSAEIHNTGLVVGTACATEGIHRWTIQSRHDAFLDETICVGVSTSKLNSTNLETTNEMWLYRAYNGVLYHGGKQGTLEPFTIGDTICVEVDMKARTLSFYKNEKPLGVAFEGLPDKVYPVMLFYATSTRARASIIRYNFDRPTLPLEPKFRPIEFGSPATAFRSYMSILLRNLHEQRQAPLEDILMKAINMENANQAEREAALEIIGRGSGFAYQIGSRIYHPHLGLGVVAETLSQTGLLVVRYDSEGLVLVMPPNQVHLQTPSALKPTQFSHCRELVLSLAEYLLQDRPIDPLTRKSVQALEALLPGTKDQLASHHDVLLRLFAKFVPLALRSSQLVGVFTSETIEALLSVPVDSMPEDSPVLSAEEIQSHMEELCGKLLEDKSQIPLHESRRRKQKYQVPLKVLQECAHPQVHEKFIADVLRPAYETYLARELLLVLAHHWKGSLQADLDASYLDGLRTLYYLQSADRIAQPSKGREPFQRGPQVFTRDVLASQIEEYYRAGHVTTMASDKSNMRVSMEYLNRVVGAIPEHLSANELFLLLQCVQKELPEQAKASLLLTCSHVICHLVEHQHKDVVEQLQTLVSESSLLTEIPKTAHTLYHRGIDEIVKFNESSSLFKSAVSVMISLPCPWYLEDQDFGWFQDFRAIIDTATALTKHTPFPERFIAACRSELASSSMSAEGEETWLDNQVWTKERDAQLVSWVTQYPMDWSAPVDTFMFGSAQSGQLAEGSGSFSGTPVPIDSIALIQPKQVLCGSMCTVVLADDGTVYSCGKGEYGRLGVGSTDNQYVLKQLTSFQKVSVKSISVSKGSYGHALAIDTNGGLWSWGDGDYGKLGHGNTSICAEPKQVESMAGHVVTAVSCGFKHSACINSQGELFTWGHGEYGRLGHGDVETHSFPTKVDHFNGQVVAQVACGSSHTLAVLDNGTAWSWGDGDYGKLGHGDTNSKNIPTMLEMLAFHTIKKVDAGEEFSMCLTTTGQVLSWGRYNNNVLGHGDDGHLFFPLIITALDHITMIDIAAGSQHCLALSEEFQVYAWGCNEDQQLGLGHSDAILLPQRVEFFEDKKIRQISAGSSHSAAWTSDPNGSRSLSASLPSSIPPQYDAIQDMTMENIVRRLFALQCFSERFLNQYHFFENSSRTLRRWNLQRVPKLLLPKQKQHYLRMQLSKTSTEESDLVIQVNGDEDDLFESLFFQLHPLDGKELRASFCPFKVRLDGDVVEFKELMDQLVEQLHDGAGDILCPTPNTVDREQPEYMFQSPVELSRPQGPRLSFFGRLVGIAIRTKLPFRLNLAPSMYKLLTLDGLSRSDWRQMDRAYYTSMEILGRSAMTQEEFDSLFDLEQFPPVTCGSETVALSYATREQYASTAMKERMYLWENVAKRIYRGLREIIPGPLLSLFTCADYVEWVGSSPASGEASSPSSPVPAETSITSLAEYLANHLGLPSVPQDGAPSQ